MNKLIQFLEAMGIQFEIDVTLEISPNNLEIANQSAHANGLRLVPTEDANWYRVISNDDTMPLPEIGNEVVFHD